MIPNFPGTPGNSHFFRADTHSNRSISPSSYENRPPQSTELIAMGGARMPVTHESNRLHFLQQPNLSDTRGQDYGGHQAVAINPEFPNCQQQPDAYFQSGNVPYLNRGRDEPRPARFPAEMQNNPPQKRARDDGFEPANESNKRQRTHNPPIHSNASRDVAPSRVSQGYLIREGNDILNDLITMIRDKTGYYSAHRPLQVTNDLALGMTSHLESAMRAHFRAQSEQEKISDQQLGEMAAALEKMADENKLSDFYFYLNTLTTNDVSLCKTSCLVSLLSSYRNKEPSEGAKALLQTIVQKIKGGSHTFLLSEICAILEGMHLFYTIGDAQNLLMALWDQKITRAGHSVCKRDIEKGLNGLKLFSNDESLLGDYVNKFRHLLICALRYSEKLDYDNYTYILHQIHGASPTTIEKAIKIFSPTICKSPPVLTDENFHMLGMLRYCEPDVAMPILNHYFDSLRGYLKQENSRPLNWQVVKIVESFEKLGLQAKVQELLIYALPVLETMRWRNPHPVAHVMSGLVSFPNNQFTERALLALGKIIRQNSFTVFDTLKALSRLQSRPASEGKTAVFYALLSQIAYSQDPRRQGEMLTHLNKINTFGKIGSDMFFAILLMIDSCGNGLASSSDSRHNRIKNEELAQLVMALKNHLRSQHPKSEANEFAPLTRFRQSFESLNLDVQTLILDIVFAKR